MKVFLSGYGKMGRMLEELALEHGGTDNITFVLGRVMEVQGE